MPKYKDIAKEKEFKKKRREAFLKRVEERMYINFFWKVVYGVDK